jgi:proline racemase
MGFIIMEPEDTPPMSGSNTICVATVLLETGIVPMREPVTDLVLESPGGLVQVRAECLGGKVTSVTLQNLPSFVVHDAQFIDVKGYGPVEITTAFGGDSFVMSRASDHGFELKPSEAAELARFGMLLRSAANSQLNFVHPLLPDWKHHSFAYITGELGRNDLGELTSTNVCVINPGKLDRSPTGTGVSALMAVMHSRGLISVGESFIGLSIIGSQFTGQIVSETELAGRPAIIPRISGRGYIYGTSHFYVDPSDPWPLGYRVADTWPGVT